MEVLVSRVGKDMGWLSPVVLTKRVTNIAETREY